MSTITSVPQAPAPAVQENTVLNIASAGRRWFVELAPVSRAEHLRHPGARVEVSPEVGREMVEAARREGSVDNVHRWGPWTTWHLVR